jgi:hypothetical protein
MIWLSQLYGLEGVKSYKKCIPLRCFKMVGPTDISSEYCFQEPEDIMFEYVQSLRCTKETKNMTPNFILN